MASRRPRAASPAASIEDWLNLVDPDGAFLTPSGLKATFPHGFDPMPTDQRVELRSRVAELTSAPGAPGAELRQWLLATVLEWGDSLVEGQQLPATSLIRVAEHGVHLRPTAALVDVDDANTIRVAVFVWPRGTRLERRPDIVTTGDTWPASPTQRAETWCRESGIPLALVTDDDQTVLLWAPRGAPTASCRWCTSDLADERILQAGLLSILGARRFFAVEVTETLEALFRKAADAEAEITKGLGHSVRRSVELLVAAMSRADVASGGAVLGDIAATEVYESSVTVLMRLVFLLFAEERRLLPAEDPLWAESYSVLTLRDDLRGAALRDGDDALERRSTAWHRLLATFRAVHGGVNHDRLTLPPYGGSLFDPERFPFLEGRRRPDHLFVGGVDLGPAEDAHHGTGRPVAIDDRTVLAILDALLTIEVKAGRTKVAQRVSYKALDVEQIGHCYEGLLDHGATPIDVLALGLVGPDGGEPETTVDELEAHLSHGTDALCDWLADKDRCGGSANAHAGRLQKRPEGIDLARLRVACGHDDDTVARVLPFWGLIRTDLRGLPIVLLPGSKYVTQTSTRRNMGAQYTTKALAEEVVQYALEPLVYEPGPQNEADPAKWQLRTPAEIIDLRVCDPAVGSGAILTAAGRYLADRLIESVNQFGSGEGRFAGRLNDLANASADEQVVLARREIVDHCLYGVDKNPVAAEMAKLSLWLTTMARERPFTFLDHAIQVGDSLLGITDMEQLRWLHLEPAKRQGVAGFEVLVLDDYIAEAKDLAGRLQELSVVTVRDAHEKQRLHEQLRVTLASLSVVADAVVGAALSTAGKHGPSMEERLSPQLQRVRAMLDGGSSGAERSVATASLRGVSTNWLRTGLPDDTPAPWERVCLHWPIAFPEVFLRDRSRFDVLVGNPPFLGGTKISESLGQGFRQHLSDAIARRSTNRADLVAFFLLRSADVGKGFGLLATNTVSQGDTREVGLGALIDERGWTVTRASKSSPWPGDATLEISKLWMRSGEWQQPVVLDGRTVDRIDSLLAPARRAAGEPFRLAANTGICFLGDQLNSLGFVLSAEDADRIGSEDPKSLEVIFPYLTGEDLNTHPTHQASRLVINFRDWPLEKARRYPSALQAIRERAKPDIDVKASKNYKGWADRWWQFWMYKSALHSSIDVMDRVILLAKVSKTVQPVLISTGPVFTDMVIGFALDDFASFAVLASSFHYWWAQTYASTMRTDLRYSPTDCFETFALPIPSTRMGSAGEELNESRKALLVSERAGLTKMYNRIHDREELDPAIERLRQLHMGVDIAVRDAYGWSDLELNHRHWETPQGMRFTVCPSAKDEILDRLLELNHQRYAEEVAAGLHDKTAKKAPKKAKSANDDQGSLL